MGINTVSNFSYILSSGTPWEGMALISYGEGAIRTETERSGIARDDTLTDGILRILSPILSPNQKTIINSNF